MFQPEGIEKEFTDTFLIDLTNTTTKYDRTVSIHFPEKAVEGSELVTVSVTG